MRQPTTQKYPAEWKERAVKLAVESEQPMAQTARDLGVHDNTLPTWSGKSHRAARQEQEGNAAHLSEALKRLRKDTARFKEERESFKQAAASCAQQLPCSTPGGKRRRGSAPCVGSVGLWKGRAAAPTRGAAAPYVQRYCAQGRGPYGTRRIKPLCAQEGLQGSRRRIGRILAQADVRGNTRRKVNAPRRAEQAQTVAPNQRQREVPVHGPETVYVGDMTSLPTGEGGRDLAVVRGLCSRAVGGWSMATPLRAELVTQACTRALWQRQPTAGLIMPTDRGSQDGAESSRQLLSQHGIEPSMSRTGHWWDNAVAARCFHTVKTDWIYLEDSVTHEAAQPAVFAYLEVVSHRQRGHSANGSLAPLVYEQALQTREILCPAKC